MGKHAFIKPFSEWGYTFDLIKKTSANRAITGERCQFHGADRMLNNQRVYPCIMYAENPLYRGGAGRNVSFRMFSKAVLTWPCQNWEIVWEENGALSWVLSHDEWLWWNWICLTLGATGSKSSCVDFMSTMTWEMEAFSFAFCELF